MRMLFVFLSFGSFNIFQLYLSCIFSDWLGRAAVLQNLVLACTESELPTGAIQITLLHAFTDTSKYSMCVSFLKLVKIYFLL